MKCQHTKETTPFCPHCGEALTDANPLGSLLAYLKNNAKRAGEEVAKIADECDLSDYGDKKFLQSKERILNKWERWAKAVENAIENLPNG